MFKNISTLCSNTSMLYRSFLHQIMLPRFTKVSDLGKCRVVSKSFHTTNSLADVMEFFDDKKNWGENEVKVGRGWQLDELRIKSNVDLHKLWYILLKERNMLLTMEHECNEKMRLFPSPERKDKIEISMKNLETVVRERNKAFHELETGETGERTGKVISNVLGVNFYYKPHEHVLPKLVNSKWLKSPDPNGKAVKKFLLLYREKLYNEKRKSKNRQRNEVMMLLRRNPKLDINLLKQKFPDVDIPKLLKNDKTRGHYVPEIEKI